MTKYARVIHRGAASYALVEDACARIVEGNIFENWKAAEEKVPLADVKLLAPVKPRQVIAIGMNYYTHARECGRDIPAEPVVFLKGVNAVIGPGENIVLPRMAPDEVDYEAELAIVIGKEAKCVSESDAGEHIFGYACGNDVSARDCQLRRDPQWARGKSFDTFAPIGPHIVAGVDGDNLGISLSLNGKVMQMSRTSDMIFSCRRLVSYLSHCMTLYPASIIMTGTPSGVGFIRKPPVYLREGDVVSVEIEKIGVLTNRVAREE